MPACGPCMDCACCTWWSGVAGGLLGVAGRLTRIASELACRNAAGEQTILLLQAAEAALADDNRRLVRANKALNARKNHIRTVPASDRTSTGVVGRPRGTKPTINRRPQNIDRREVADMVECPEGHPLSGITETYTRVVREARVITENVEHTVCRRWCRTCKKQYTAGVAGAAKHARVSAGCSAAATILNMNGLSHGKTAGFCGDTLSCGGSRLWSYRNKISAARRLEPEYHSTRRDILREPYLQCDEMWWKLPKSNSGKIMVVRGGRLCLAVVVWSANIKAVKEMLPNYKGTVGQDSNPIWLHTGGDHQMCMQHQRRLSKKDIVHRSLKGDPLKFLTSLRRLDYKHHVYDKIKDSRTRMVAARCLEKERSELMHGEYRDDKEGTIARRQKRHRREGWFMTTHLYQKDIREVAPDNNGVERVNRRFVAVRSDGGGNRTQRGMDANSVLFTVMATDWINGKSLYEHLMRSASGDG